MKYLKTFESIDFKEEPVKMPYISNFVKSKKFPTYKETKGITKSTYSDNSDLDFIYDLNKHEIGKYLNLWFQGMKREIKGEVTYDEIVTVVKVDNETSQHLYQRKYNPLTMTIMKSGSIYNMKCMIHSIDDSSYGIWFNYKTYEELVSIRFKLIQIINGLLINDLNGGQFIETCKQNGADPSSVDYN